MEKEKVWGKLRKTVVDGVTVAAEKTEEFTKLGKAKLDVLAVKRKISKRQTELGEIVYRSVKEGKSDGVMDTDEVRNIIVELGAYDNELGEKQKMYDDLRSKAESDMETVREKAKSGMDDIKNRAKTKVDRMRKKAETNMEETPAGVSEEEKTEAGKQ